ncbi:MAG: IMP cyclohydrolase [Chloroflexi bacterium]|nr:IMP cyclohydrolase [Chloroflexota bacterium]
MYIGRFVIVGQTPAGEWYLGYRVSSRSFPNRRIVVQEDRAVVLPTPDAPPSDNPYISYNCLRQHGQIAIVANGSHVDPAIDKVSLGYPLRDALALAMLAMDFEHDHLSTPRIAAAVDLSAAAGYLAIVARDQLCIQKVDVQAGEASLIATYERTAPTPIQLAGSHAEDLAEAIFASEYEHPVASLAAILQDGRLRLAARSAR